MGLAFILRTAAQQLLQLGMIRSRYHIHDRHSGQIIGAFVAEHFHVVVIGVDVHAIQHIGNRVTALVHQQREALLCIMADDFGVLQLLAQAQKFDDPVHHQGEQVAVIVGHDAPGAQRHAGLDGIGGEVVFEKNHRDRLAEAIEVRHDAFKAAVAECRATQHQLPGATFQGPQQIILTQRQLRTGRTTGIAQGVHQLLGLILGIMGDQKT